MAYVLEDPMDGGRYVMEDAPVAPARAKFDLRGDAYDRAMNYSGRDAVAGAVRGAGSIGATVLSPFESGDENAARRKAMDDGLRSLGANPDSMQFGVNKLLAEVLGTYGIGGGLGKLVQMIPGAAKALPTLLPAIESAGMSANGARGTYGMANRVAGSTLTGGATAGLVDPSHMLEGGVAGAVTPPVLKTIGGGMQALGGAARSAALNPTMQQTARESVEAGYVLPPNLVSPSFGARTLESFSGKQATQQIASTRNTATTEKLVRESLGIADDIPLTKATLESLRKTAGKAYADVSAISPQAASDLEALKVARNEAQGWFKAYNRSASPTDLATAKNFRSEADNLENLLEFHALQAGKPDLIPRLQAARREIAKTYTVERALNDASGTVDARVLGRMYEKGSPLSGGLETAGRFASAFPSVAKSPQQVGSPGAHNLQALLGLTLGGSAGGAGALTGMGVAGTGGLGAAGLALPFVVPPVARSVMFSGPMQRSMAGRQGPGLVNQSIDDLLPLIYRTSPLLGASSGL